MFQGKAPSAPRIEALTLPQLDWGGQSPNWSQFRFPALLEQAAGAPPLDFGIEGKQKLVPEKVIAEQDTKPDPIVARPKQLVKDLGGKESQVKDPGQKMVPKDVAYEHKKLDKDPAGTEKSEDGLEKGEKLISKEQVKDPKSGKLLTIRTIKDANGVVWVDHLFSDGKVRLARQWDNPEWAKGRGHEKGGWVARDCYEKDKDGNYTICRVDKTVFMDTNCEVYGQKAKIGRYAELRYGAKVENAEITNCRYFSGKQYYDENGKWIQDKIEPPKRPVESKPAEPVSTHIPIVTTPPVPAKSQEAPIAKPKEPPKPQFGPRGEEVTMHDFKDGDGEVPAYKRIDKIGNTNWVAYGPETVVDPESVVEGGSEIKNATVEKGGKVVNSRVIGYSRNKKEVVVHNGGTVSHAAVDGADVPSGGILYGDKMRPRS